MIMKKQGVGRMSRDVELIAIESVLVVLNNKRRWLLQTNYFSDADITLAQGKGRRLRKSSQYSFP
jgi:hypothetical protein